MPARKRLHQLRLLNLRLPRLRLSSLLQMQVRSAKGCPVRSNLLGAASRRAQFTMAPIFVRSLPFGHLLLSLVVGLAVFVLSINLDAG